MDPTLINEKRATTCGKASSVESSPHLRHGGALNHRDLAECYIKRFACFLYCGLFWVVFTLDSPAVGRTSFQQLCTLPRTIHHPVRPVSWTSNGRAPKVPELGFIIPENKEIHSHDVGTSGSGLRPVKRARVGGGQGIRQCVQVLSQHHEDTSFWRDGTKEAETRRYTILGQSSTGRLHQLFGKGNVPQLAPEFDRSGRRIAAKRVVCGVAFPVPECSAAATTACVFGVHRDYRTR